MGVRIARYSLLGLEDLPVDRFLLTPGPALCPPQRGAAALKRLHRPLQTALRPLDDLTRPVLQLDRHTAQSLGPLDDVRLQHLERTLPLGDDLLPLIRPLITLVGQPLPLVSLRVTIVGLPLALIGHIVPSISDPLPHVGSRPVATRNRQATTPTRGLLRPVQNLGTATQPLLRLRVQPARTLSQPAQRVNDRPGTLGRLLTATHQLVAPLGELSLQSVELMIPLLGQLLTQGRGLFAQVRQPLSLVHQTITLIGPPLTLPRGQVLGVTRPRRRTVRTTHSSSLFGTSPPARLTAALTATRPD